jgi:hypothetical protein
MHVLLVRLCATDHTHNAAHAPAIDMIRCLYKCTHQCWVMTVTHTPALLACAQERLTAHRPVFTDEVVDQIAFEILA